MCIHELLLYSRLLLLQVCPTVTRVVHGNTLTAAVVVESVMRVLAEEDGGRRREFNQESCDAPSSDGSPERWPTNPLQVC